MGESEAPGASVQRWSVLSALREVAFLAGMAVVIAVVVKTFVAQAF